jgi:hypothetical protein
MDRAPTLALPRGEGCGLGPWSLAQNGLLSKHSCHDNQFIQFQRATWFLLLLLSAETFLAIPVLRYSQRSLTTCGIPTGGGYACHAYSTWGVWYWPMALVLAYFAIAIFYIRRSQSRGLEIRVRPFVVAGIGIAIIVTAMGYRAVHLPVGEIVFLAFVQLRTKPTSE